MARYAFGIDLGGTTSKQGLFSEYGVLLESWEVPSDSSNNGEKVLPDIAAAIKAKMEEKDIAIDDVIGVGIGVPGPVMKEKTVNHLVNLGWGVVNVAKELSALLDGIPVKVGNDANVAALGEMWVGGGKGFSSIVMVTLGTGVGGGIIVNGKILAGANGAGGEIGHMVMNPKEKIPCNCGSRGCLEQYTSATGIVRHAREVLAENTKPTVLKNDETLSSKAVFDAAKEGDEVALDIVEFFGETLGHGLAMISAVADPEAFVIGGGVSRAGQIILDVVQKYYQQYAFHATKKCQFRMAALGNNAGMYGAVKMVL